MRGLLDPSALDQPALLEAIEQWVERGHAEAERAARSRVDEFGDLISMTRVILELGENEQLGGALLPFAVVVWRHILDYNIS